MILSDLFDERLETWHLWNGAHADVWRSIQVELPEDVSLDRLDSIALYETLHSGTRVTGIVARVLRIMMEVGTAGVGVEFLFEFRIQRAVAEAVVASRREVVVCRAPIDDKTREEKHHEEALENCRC